MMRQRDEYVDVAKGIAILMIVCIHTEVFGVFGYPLTFIAVPLFFFISGFYDRSERGVGKWLPKSLKSLILPAFIWIVLVTAYVQFLGFVKDKSWGELPFGWYNVVGNNGPAWFLFALLFAKILVWAMQKAKLPKPIIGGVSLVIGYWGMNVDMPLLLDEGCAALPLYVAGKYGYPHMKDFLSNRLLLTVGVVALLACCCGYASFTIVPQANGMYAPFYLIALLAMVLAFFPFLYLSGRLHGQKWLESMGQHSLGVMLLHAPMCHTVAVILNRVFVPGALAWIVCFLFAYVAVVALSYWLTVAIEKYCPVLLGK